MPTTKNIFDAIDEEERGLAQAQADIAAGRVVPRHDA